jgi:uncharacterized protein with PIN domain
MFKEIILPILLSIALLILGFYLDYLNNKYPHWFESKKKKTVEHKKKLEPKSRIRQTITNVNPFINLLPQKSRNESEVKKECSRCSTYRREMKGVLTVLVEDEYGTLYRCPECRKFYNFEASGGPFKEVEIEWVKKIWPGLKTD